jgi:hypothetical protein
MVSKNLLSCLIVALALRLAFIFLAFPHLQTKMHLRDDGDGYLRLAQTIRDGEYNDVTIGPVYPFFVAACGSSVTVKVVQAILDTSVCALLVWLAGVLVRERAAILAAWFWAVYPFAIWRVAFLNKETVLTFLLILYVCAQVRALQNRCWREWALAGVLLGVVNLCKPTYLLWPVVLLLIAWKATPRPKLLALIGAMLLVVVPWIVRNYRLTGAILPVATQNGGVTVFVGNFQPTAGMWETPKRALWEAEVARIRAENPGASEVQIQSAFYRATWQEVRSNPAKAAELYVRKLWRFWFLSSARREPVASLLIQITYLFLALIGWWRLRPLSAEQRLLPAMLIFAMFFHAFGVGELRFSLPVFPFVCVLAAAAFYRQERRTEATLSAAPVSE